MKIKILLPNILLAIATIGFAQDAKYQLSSHILDITKGQPAADVKISLSQQNNSGEWTTVDEKFTDKNGRITDFLKEVDGVDQHGVYKLTYFVEPYFERAGQSSFYPSIEVVFEIKDGNHYHVPITLSPYGYSTYRGN